MKIVVLAGGISPERDVSLSSGKMIYEALREKGHQAILLDVYLGIEADACDLESCFLADADWARGIGSIDADSPDIEAVKKLRANPQAGYFGPNVLSLCQMADITFIALHGEDGENGKVQACFDLMGIRYTGSDYLGSALAMDKVLAKELFAHHGIPTPQGVALGKSESKKTLPAALAYPVIVKTSTGGSSVGVAIARDDSEYATALESAYRYGETALVESYIAGREFSVGVLDGKALPVTEIAPKEGFFDYKNKYQADATVETCPADISEENTAMLKALAEKVFRILRLGNYARIDFMMDKDENVYCLEANTLPGMSAASLLPKEAAAVGLDFAKLCETIIEDKQRTYGRLVKPSGEDSRRRAL